ncbi:MAG: hypothetical protein ACIWVG_09125, partial [Gloeotrichia echinulata HAB0833]
MSPLTLNLDTVHLTDEQFYQLCQNNRELKFERTASGELIIMSPVGGESGIALPIQMRYKIVSRDVG